MIYCGLGVDTPPFLRSISDTVRPPVHEVDLPVRYNSLPYTEVPPVRRIKKILFGP